MVSSRSENNTIKVSVKNTTNVTKTNASSINSSNPVNASNNQTKMYEQRALAHANNAKYYSDLSEEFANKSEASATRSENSAINAQNYVNELLNNESFINVSENIDLLVEVGEKIENIDLDAIINAEENSEKSATSALNSANIATVQAEIATSQAVIATEKATQASNYATNAQTSATNALNSASSATTSASTATTKANEAKTSATSASQSATSASSSASTATTQANNAKTSETNASTSSKNAKIWAEGTDAEVQALGGIHSSKEWAKQGIGIDKLISSKAYESNGLVLTDEQGFNDVQKYAHSTFDISKFEVTGSPTITSDGVASGFTGSQNHIYKLVDIPVGSRIKFIFKLDSYSASTLNSRTLFSFVSNSTCLLELRLYKEGTKASLVGATGETTREVLAEGLNIKPYTVIEYYNGTADIYFGDSLDNLILDRTVSGIYDLPVTKINFGASYANALQAEDVEISLKDTATYVNNEPLFNGNKTGLDVINGIEIPYTWSKTGSKIVDVAYRDRVIDVYNQLGQADYYTIDETNKNFTLPMGEIYGMIENAKTKTNRTIGEIISVNASENYVPDGTLPCDGAEYTKAQFSDLWSNYLTGKDLNKQISITTGTFEGGILYGVAQINIPNQESVVICNIIEDDVTTKRYVHGMSVGYIENGNFYTWSGTLVVSNIQPNSYLYIKRIIEPNADTDDKYLIKYQYSIDNITFNDFGSSQNSNSLTYSVGGGAFKFDFNKSYLENNSIKTYLMLALLNTCTYSDYETDITTYGQCSKFAVDVDKGTFKVPLKPQPKRYLIDKKEPTDGDPSWYNLYSDGWLEQGGTGTGGNNTTGSFQAFIKSYRDSNVTVTAIVDRSDKGNLDNGASNTIKIVNVSADGFYQGTNYVGSATGEFRSYPFRWRACGYCDTVVEEVLKSFVVVANGQTNQSMMDWSAWASGLQGKMNADHSNDTKPYIVEVSDKSILPSWYRIWSDGWCEQGGKYTYNTGATSTISFLKNYLSTEQMRVTYNMVSSRGATNYGREQTVNSYTTSNFTVTTSTFNGTEAFWEAKGYIA